MNRRRMPLRNRLNCNENRSLLLEDYRDGRHENLQLNDIVRHVIQFAIDRDGSKFIQVKLNDATDHRKNMIFQEIRPHLRMLIMNTFGNFVVQRFFDVGAPDQQMEIINEIRNNFLLFSLHKYGCRVVQRAIEVSSMQFQNYLVYSADKESFLRMATDANGNHVIQKIFRVTQVNVQDTVFTYLLDSIYDLCLDLYGCRTIQCLLEKGTTIHRTNIYFAINRNPRHLIQDRYGNYVIQHALRFCSMTERNTLTEFIIQNVVYLSQQKYASNVVEECIKTASPQLKNFALRAFYSRNPEEVKLLCLDAFANYVIQKLLYTADIVEIQKMHDKIEQFFRQMRRHVCGRKIIEIITNRLG